MRRLVFISISLIASLFVSGDERPSLSFVIHGYAPLAAQNVGEPYYGAVQTALFVDDPVVVTISLLNAPTTDVAKWADYLRWDVRHLDGTPANASVALQLSAPKPPAFAALKKNATHANFVISGLTEGRYVVTVRWHDDHDYAAEPRKLSIYRGDESAIVSTAYYRNRAEAANNGTLEGYKAARELLLKAAETSNDPGLYQELGDASAAWADPNETAKYYERARDLAEANITARFGPRGRWPKSAVTLYTRREQTARVFRSLVPYYTANFNDVRVVALHDRSRDAFQIQRRSDGSIIRTVDRVD